MHNRSIYLLIGMSIILLSCINKNEKQYIDDYFIYDTNRISTNMYDINNTKLNLVIEKRKINGTVKKAIVYSIEDNKINTYLTINGSKVLGSKNETIIDVGNNNSEFNGWDIGILKDKGNKIELGLTLKWLTEKKENKEYAIVLKWERKNTCFSLNKIVPASSL